MTGRLSLLLLPVSFFLGLNVFLLKETNSSTNGGGGALRASDNNNPSSLDRDDVTTKQDFTRSSSASSSTTKTKTTTTQKATATTNNSPSQKGDTLLQELRPLGVAEYLVVRNSPDVVTADDDDKQQQQHLLPMVMVVHHREFHAGCHTFERFFHPTWETIVVVGQDMEEQFRLKELARKNAKSPAIHFALLNATTTMTGEWLARQVALKILKHNNNENNDNKSITTTPPLMFSTHCDIHPLPQWHAQHKPFDQIVSRMVQEFLREDRLNQQQQHQQPQTNVNDYRHMWDAAPLDEARCRNVFEKNKQRPLLVMNVAMVETLPSTETLEGSKFHSHEVGLNVSWSERFHSSEQKPWMSDVSTWVEDHLTLYNTTLLETIVDDLAQVHATVSAGVKALPVVLCRRGWKAVRLNDEPMFYDFAKSQHQSSGPAGNFTLFDPSKYGSVSLDWLFTRSVVGLAEVNSPLGCLREYMRLRVKADIHVSIVCIIARSHFQRNHVPEKVWTNQIGDNEDLVEAIMKLHGYELARKTEASLDFVSIPSYDTKPHDWVVQGLREGGSKGIVVGPMPGKDLNHIGLLRNGTLNPESFFTGHIFHRTKWRKTGRNGVLEAYGKSAVQVCQLLRNNTYDWNAGSSLLKPAEVKSTLSPISDLCQSDFEWTTL